MRGPALGALARRPVAVAAGIAVAAVIAAAAVVPAAAQSLSTSVMRPTVLDPTTGMVSGALPGAAGPVTYYLAIDLAPGGLTSQLEITGRPGGERRVTLQLLDPEARVAASAFVRAGFGAKDDRTERFAIDASRRHLLRLIVEGEETGRFCVLLGGTALPNVTPQSCPAAAAGAAAVADPAPASPPSPVEMRPPEPSRPPVEAHPAPPPVPPKTVEVVVSRCEERLRVGADVLFDFDRAELRPEAAPALQAVAGRVRAADSVVVVEGHTDGKGTDAYNQVLSERRAAAVREALVERGARASRLVTRGFGKRQPIAPNARPDGSDDPEGRQRNRRVEVVVNTCG